MPAPWSGWLSRASELRAGLAAGFRPHRRTLIRCGSRPWSPWPRSTRLKFGAFSRGHVVAFGEIVRQSEELNHVADMLGIENGSLMAGDVGGLLWTSKLKVYDLLGLTDRTVARTFNRDKPAFYEYIFGDVRPTFIKGHMQTLKLAGLMRISFCPGLCAAARHVADGPAGRGHGTPHLRAARRRRRQERQVDEVRRMLGPSYAESR